MKIVLDLATSADGFIARPDGDSDWVSEYTEEFFRQRARDLGALAVGRKTFEKYRGVVYPVEGALNIVISKEGGADSSPDVAYASSPEEAVQIAEAHRSAGLLVAGGATVSKAFFESGLIDEVYFSVHPVLLIEGIKPFGDLDVSQSLSLLEEKQLEDGFVELHYAVKK